MSAPIALALLIPVAYLCGSVPFGLLVGLSRGVDVRRAGSQNIGASNVGRLLGRRFFWVVFVLDAAKGLGPMLAASAVVRGGHVALGPGIYGLWMAVGFAAIVGHMFSLFLRFRGGKGVATTAGALLGLYPFFFYPCLVMVAVFLLLRKGTGYVSVGSMAGAITFPVSYLTMGLWRGVVAAGGAVAADGVLGGRGSAGRLRAPGQPGPAAGGDGEPRRATADVTALARPAR